jgi:dihydropteroate synthase
MPPFEIMGVVNVTPDSFSDGGQHAGEAAAIAHARRLVGEGAAIVDVGGESTRPGAAPVPAEEERERVVGVVAGVAGLGLGARISVDTMKRSVAEAAADAGASYVNDVTAFRHDPEMAGLVADRGLECCLMHMLGEPRTMQRDPHYDDVVSEVKAFLEQRLAAAVAAGIPEERVQLDPGIGFGKTLEHNLELLRRLGEIAAIGRPVVLGTSRKSFIGRITGRDVSERVHGTVATCVLGLERGARVFRVHDVAAVHDGLAVAAATFRPHGP